MQKLHKLTVGIRSLPRAFEKDGRVTLPIADLDDFIFSYFELRREQYEKVSKMVKDFELITDEF